MTLPVEQSVQPPSVPFSSVLGRLPALPGLEARSWGQALGMTATVADFLLRCGHVDVDRARRFLEPKLAHLTPPHEMADRALAADRLAHAVRRQEPIAVFGDYDCDGITSAAIVTEILRALGGTATPFLASRFAGGYGVSAAAVERVLASGARVLVTCDCGSSDHESLGVLRARGVDVIVIDHHLVPEDPLPALAFLNPHRTECAFPYKGLASCGLALSVGAALRAALGVELDLRQWLDLVAIGTIADVAPLDGDNRVLVRAGLAALRDARRPGVRALLELAKIDPGAAITSEDVAFRIAPRINAPGRLGAPDAALELLLARSPEEAQALSLEIEQLSVSRRALQDHMIADAVQEIEAQGWAERPGLVLGREGWNHGIVGIVAGRLAARYQRPVVVIGFEQGRGRGSVRGPMGSRLFDTIASVADVLQRFGGHQAAAGLEVTLDRLPELRERFEGACIAVNGADGARPADAQAVVRLAPEDEPSRVLADLMRLEPCGPTNPAPQLAVEGDIVSAREVRGGHLKLELDLPGGYRMAGFGVEMGPRAAALKGRVLVLGRLRPDRFRGGNAVEIRADEICA
ncbi:MAG TPA: single-stranded-DNA-specific exonuclease RecJ [Polyangiaceae bacterium]